MAPAPLQTLSYETALRQVFRDATSNNQVTQTWLNELCQSVTTNQPAGETYGFLQAAGGFQEWKGPVTAETIKMWTKSVVSKWYNRPIYVPRMEWSFDHFNVLRPQVQDAAEQADNLKFSLVTQVLNQGATSAQVGIDGANFFSTSHAWDGGTAQSNSISVNLNDLNAVVDGSGTQPSFEEAARLMMRGARTMIAFRNTAGERQVIPSARFLVMVPLHLAEPFGEAIQQKAYQYGVGNPIPTLAGAGLNFTYSVVVNPLLQEGSGEAFENAIAMFRVDAPMKPLMIQELQKLDVAILAEGSEYFTLNNQAVIMPTWAGAATNWMWTSALKITMTRS